MLRRVTFCVDRKSPKSHKRERGFRCPLPLLKPSPLRRPKEGAATPSFGNHPRWDWQLSNCGRRLKSASEVAAYRGTPQLFLRLAARSRCLENTAPWWRQAGACRILILRLLARSALVERLRGCDRHEPVTFYVAAEARSRCLKTPLRGMAGGCPPWFLLPYRGKQDSGPYGMAGICGRTESSAPTGDAAAARRAVEVIPPAGEMSPQATKGGRIAGPYKAGT